MPVAKVGEKTSLDRKEFLELKSKGEKVLFRIASTNYYYEGKHFILKEDGKWNVTLCPRVNNELDCDFCSQYFAILKQKKQAKADKDVKAEKSLDKAGQKVKPAIAFYYPVLDRENKASAIFKTTLMIRLALEEKVEEGVDVLNVDWIVKRTEKPGSYYTLTRVDSSDTKKLSKDEEAELKKAKEVNVGIMVGGKKGSMDYTVKQTEEVFDTKAKSVEKSEDDIPF